MENANQPIYPDPMRGAEQSFTNQSPNDLPMGLTKREYFAGIAMQGILANNGSNFSSEFIIGLSVKFSDALLAELDKHKSE